MANYPALKILLASAPYNAQNDVTNLAQINALQVATYPGFNGPLVQQALIMAQTAGPPNHTGALTTTNDFSWLELVATGQIGPGETVTTAQADPSIAAHTLTLADQLNAIGFYRMVMQPGSVSLPASASTVFGGLVTALIASNIITQAAITAITALVLVNIPWPEANGWWDTINNKSSLQIADFAVARAS